MYRSRTCSESVRQVAGRSAYKLEEAVGVPQRQQRLPHALPDTAFGDDEVAAAQPGDAIRNQRIASEPSRSKTSLTSG